ncbi:SIMPL domain-containing protein, partial [Patescibacteria group bacterium]|nr:SIMPL domain-containing protein [Patescibacteria group bacterium]
MKTSLNILLILCVTAIVIVALVTAQDKIPEDRYSVSATGRVFAKPDIANLTVGFKTEVKKTATEAVQENSEKMNEIIKELKALDIESKDIKTSSYNLSPVYNWTQDRGQVLKGYEVSQNVTIKIRDLDNIGSAIAKTSEKGANQIGDINFTIDDEEALKSQARDEAIAKAKEKAKAVAKSTGMKLGKIVNVVENQYYYPIRSNYAKSLEFGIGGGEEITAPQIETGENEVMVEI